jgi:nucleoside 2-deoxyribosyltransferase
MAKHWSHDRAFKRFARDMRENLVPKIMDSAYVIAIAPPTGSDTDIRMAVEIGYAILSNKPLIVVAPAGRHVGEKLLRIADHVITGEMDTEAGREAMHDKLRAVLNQ